MKKKVLSFIAAAALAMTAFASLAISASAANYNASKIRIGQVLAPGDVVSSSDSTIGFYDDNTGDYNNYGRTWNVSQWVRITDNTSSPAMWNPDEGTMEDGHYAFAGVILTAVESVSFQETVLNLAVNGTGSLSATVAPGDAYNKGLTWTSSDPSVATVNNNGVVTGVSRGTATITATSQMNNTKSASYTVNVSAPATAEYTQVGNYTGDADAASAWSVTVTPGDDAITSLDVKVNNKSSNEGAWNGMTVTEGTVVFGVAVNLAADDVNSVTAVVNGSDVTTTKVIKAIVEIL